MSTVIGSVIIASTQSVAKVFVIGAVGFLAVLYPRQAPFLPRNLVGKVARFSFHALTVPLIYSTIAIAVTIESVGNYWFVFAGAFVVIAVSYAVATSLSCLLDKSTDPQDYKALKQAAAFPNIVALPILIFPSLCEFPVVYEGYIQDAPEDADAAYLQRQCVAQSTTMIFCYFFSWSLAFWSFGHRQLMHAASERHREETIRNEDMSNDDLSLAEKATVANDPAEVNIGGSEDEQACACDDSTVEHADTNMMEQRGELVASSATPDSSLQPELSSSSPSLLSTIWLAFKQTISSPGFMAMAAAFITACIPPLQKALFEGGGPLRFFGSAMETLGTASSPISTMVVAASLVPPRQPEPSANEQVSPLNETTNSDDDRIIDENPGMTDPNFGPYRRKARRKSSRFHSVRASLSRGSARMLQALPRSNRQMLRLHFWFCSSRLLFTPAAIIGIILALDCSGGGLLGGVPNLAKLVIIVNSALPGALIVIVLLKANEQMAETASVVAKVYMPSYILAIFTIAAWTAVGLWVTLPDEHGKTMCRQ